MAAEPDRSTTYLTNRARATMGISDQMHRSDITQTVFTLPPSDTGIRQLFFDCDNTLVDTESAAVEACADVINKVMQDKGLPNRYRVEELVGLFWGKTTRQMIVELSKHLSFDLPSEEIREYTIFEEELVIQHIKANPLPCDGVEEVLKKLHAGGKYKLAVVSSSPIRRIRTALEASDIAQYFDPAHVYSAKNSMPAPKSKPDPAIYRWAMAENEVSPDECIAFEDSRSGARSALSAGIPTIGYVGAYHSQGQREEVTRLLLGEGCKIVMEDYSSFWNCLEYVIKEMPHLYDHPQ